MKKKALLGVVIAALSLTACGNDVKRITVTNDGGVCSMTIQYDRVWARDQYETHLIPCSISEADS